MSPVSFEFALFCCAVLLLYYAVAPRFRPVVLLAAGYVFYASWHLIYVPLLFLITLLFFMTGQRIAASTTSRRNYLIFGVVLSLALLFIFQYVNFFSGQTLVSLIVPIGISFYTFQG